MLVWFRRHPIEPEHLASVAFVRATDYEGPDALTEAFYLAWCDCGWTDDEQPDEESARAEAVAHTSHVRSGLHAFDE
jgi:hypothetical protein